MLDEYIRDRHYVPEQAHPVDSIEELPLCLQARAKNLCADVHWRAWADGVRIWFIIAHPSCLPGKDSREIAMEMMFYDQDAKLAACGVWVRRTTGHWELCRALGPEQVADYPYLDRRRLLALAT